MAEIVARGPGRDGRSPRPTRIVLRPPSADGGDDFTVTETGEGWRVRGEKPERWVRQTDFSNDEAVGFLADRLNRLGVEDAAARARRRRGRHGRSSATADNAVVFDFEPGDRRRRRDARPPRRGPALRGDAPGGRAAAARSTRRCPSAPRARPAPTWPAGSERDPTTDRSCYEIGSD